MLFRYVFLCCASLCRVLLSDALLCNAWLCYGVRCCAVLCLGSFMGVLSLPRFSQAALVIQRDRGERVQVFQSTLRRRERFECSAIFFATRSEIAGIAILGPSPENGPRKFQDGKFGASSGPSPENGQKLKIVHCFWPQPGKLFEEARKQQFGARCGSSPAKWPQEARTRQF